ncbi:MAG: FG-GAP-like repeat-containing protein, partial [Acidobacteria bacterium]|nr:FG-GAP-like repeat-containing protein [Acidobacteriota bacterium]
NRKINPSTRNQFSIVLVNAGGGNYPTRIELPHPAFNDGYTQARGQTHFDVDGDGFQDLLFAHMRNDDSLPNVPYTGRYIQVLVNRGGMSFADETTARMGDQSATTPEHDLDGAPLHNTGWLGMFDVDRDGCADLVVARGSDHVRTASPLVYRNDGGGRFQAMPAVPFTGSTPYFGAGAVPADVNGDTAIDFVVPYRDNGLDGRFGTADDFTMLVTLLNTTPAGPFRCGAATPGNRSPMIVGTLPNRRLAPDSSLNVDVSRVFVDPDGDALTFTVSSSAPHVVAVRAAGTLMALTAVSEGRATIRVTATDPGGLSTTQSFTVTVSMTASESFTDDPIRPGVTPVRALHFMELRTRIDALRRAGGLQVFPWTDPVLTAGVTRVRLAHLLELREALAGAYVAAGRSEPGWTDAAPTAGSTAIRAAHLMELRAAVLALE